LNLNTKRLRRILIGGTLAVAGGWLLHEIRKTLYQSRENADQLHHVTTDDGVELGLWRYPPKEGPSEPVLLVHGFGLNHRHLDLNEDLSVACYLRDRGYDCWAIDLRGRGSSEIPDDPWNFDDYVKKDLPAVIDYILETTDYSQLHWVGHSMGAMLYYAYAGSKDEQEKIASAVAGQGPFHGKTPDSQQKDGSTQAEGYEQIVLPVMELLRRLRIPWTGAVRTGAFWYPQLKNVFPSQLINLIINPENISHETLKQASVRAVERVGPQVLGQMLDWAIARHWKDQNGDVDYRKNVSNIQIPTRVVAGSIDNLCPPHNQKAGYEEIGTDDKDYVEAGKDNGFKVDYSHLDFVQGDHAPDEIYPLIHEWFKDHPIRQ
jgi:pimeloyl-ACP methyl ester carboxylesterase